MKEGGILFVSKLGFCLFFHIYIYIFSVLEQILCSIWLLRMRRSGVGKKRSEILLVAQMGYFVFP